MASTRWKRARYALPVAIVVAIAGGAAVPALSGAAVPAGLTTPTARQLLADAVGAQAPELSGSLTWTANLGLSDLSTMEQDLGPGGSGAASSSSSATTTAGGAAGGGFNPISLLSGSYDIDVWLDGATAEHLALIEPPADEVDLVRNGDQAWLWDSSTQTVTHVTGGGDGSSSDASGAGTSTTTAASEAGGTPLTPQQLADKLLAQVGSTTSVTTGSPLYVAGQPAFQLLVAPKESTGTTVGHIEVDVGASGALAGVPLQVAVYAQGQAAAALELGFTGVIHLGAPPASELTFVPPPGAKVTTRQLSPHGGDAPAGTPSTSRPRTTIGTGWTAVLTGASDGPAAALQQGELSGLTTVVNVAGQRARLFSTELVNVLFMPDGRYYAGLVTPSVLEADASSGS